MVLTAPLSSQRDPCRSSLQIRIYPRDVKVLRVFLLLLIVPIMVSHQNVLRVKELLTQSRILFSYFYTLEEAHCAQE